MTEVLVIGGSAGALESLLELTATLPAQLAAPLVVVLHIPPAETNLIPSLIARTTARPVFEAEDKLPLERGAIYVAPPSYHTMVERAGTLSLSVDEPVNFSRPSIDVLFDSAAFAFGAGATGLVLSGSNDDGATGLARIAAAGGRVFVQDPETAPQRAMPRAALARVPRAISMAIPQLVRELATRKAEP